MLNRGIHHRVQHLGELAPSSSRQRSGQPVPGDSSFLPTRSQEPPLAHATRSADLAPRRTQSEQATPRTADHRLGNIEEEVRSGLEIASAALGQPQRTGEVPFYTGEK